MPGHRSRHRCPQGVPVHDDGVDDGDRIVAGVECADVGPKTAHGAGRVVPDRGQDRGRVRARVAQSGDEHADGRRGRSRIEAARDDELFRWAVEREFHAAGGVRGPERGCDHVVEGPGFARSQRELDLRHAGQAGDREEASIGRGDREARVVGDIEGPDVRVERRGAEDGRSRRQCERLCGSPGESEQETKGRPREGFHAGTNTLPQSI